MVYTIKILNKIAKDRGGKCLSIDYIKRKYKLLWECKEKHTWEAVPSNVERGSWCPVCCANNRRININELIKVAKNNGGGLLSTEYHNSGEKLKWECGKKHTWFARFRDIKRGHWCPECYGNVKLDIEKLTALATKNGGKMISGYSEYKSNKSKIEWQCSFGHKWMACANAISNGTWCPRCSLFKTEEMCRSVFEEIYKKPFKRIRPRWLMGPKKYPLELDGFNEELKIAFEYNGLQHYQPIKYFGATDEKMKYQALKESIKQNKCNELGIKLIIIPYVRDPSKNKLEKIIKNLI